MTSIDPRVAPAIAQLRTTESGREVGDYLASGAVDVEVVSNAELRSGRYGSGAHGSGAQALFDPTRNTLVLSEAALAEPGLVPLLAHEGHHAMHVPPHGIGYELGAIATTTLGALRGVASLRNPMTAGIDARNARRVEPEVEAFRVQAEVAQELGIERGGRVGQASDGSAKSAKEIRESIGEYPGYRFQAGQRLFIGLEQGALVALGGGAAYHGVTRLVAPGSAATRVPAVRVLAGLVAASVAWDLIKPGLAPLLPGRS